MMITTFLNSPDRDKLLLLGIAVCAVVALTAFGQLNAWNKPFYDALSLKDVSAFVYQLVVFVMIFGALLSLNVAQAWLREMSKLRLREGLTRDLFDQWLVPRRAFRLSGAAVYFPEFPIQQLNHPWHPSRVLKSEVAQAHGHIFPPLSLLNESVH